MALGGGGPSLAWRSVEAFMAFLCPTKWLYYRH